MEKYKQEGQSDTRAAAWMRQIPETSERKRMMKYNKVRADECEEELKRFKGVVCPKLSFPKPFLCGAQKEDFEQFYWSFRTPHMQLQ